MEVVYSEKQDALKISENEIVGLYGDVLDLVSINVDINGIYYNDEWTVYRFLNGFKIFKNKRIDSILEYLDINKSLLNEKIKNLSQTDLKFVFLAYLLINNKKIIIFDYFDVGLSHSDKKKLIKIMGKLKKDGFNLIVVTNDLLFMDGLVDRVLIIEDNEIKYDGKIIDLIMSGNNYNQPILEFINMARKKGANIDYTLDHRELLKDIYRGVY